MKALDHAKEFNVSGIKLTQIWENIEIARN